MQVGVVAEQITEGLDGDDSAGHRIIRFRAGSEIGLPTFPAGTTQIGEPLAVIQKAASQHLRNYGNEMPYAGAALP